MAAALLDNLASKKGGKVDSGDVATVVGAIRGYLDKKKTGEALPAYSTMQSLEDLKTGKPSASRVVMAEAY